MRKQDKRKLQLKTTVKVDWSEVGSLVQSIQGRDAGRLYVTIQKQAVNRVYMVDGQHHPFNVPKLKNTKHIEWLKLIAQEDWKTIQAIQDDGAKNARIRQWIKAYKKENEHV